ncbi:aldehyde dehydrogenase family-domain-containing protein [Aspergillus minisclerotigenes]|uniref:Aldehyde dehydrogenase family-domain-containing protein n=1 Tax=Aspergillus minisclerotigenes TaxID=656917 RepID=A0A5N6IR89_9EURO|nr:aldehyde dehydrogenase family-domain-containing protein [Aspergillus minisclerotigenes]
MSPLALSPKTVDIVNIFQKDVEFSLVNEIHKGISPPAGVRKSMPTMLLYDANGLKLFEKITYVKEYYLTNAEIEVLETNSRRIVERIPDNAQLLELGSGNLRKIEILLREFERVGKRVDYYALDLSLSELQRTFAEVSIDDYTHVGLHGLHGTYDDAVTWLNSPENRKRPTVIMSMGSSLGNFDRPGAAKFLSQYASLLGPSDMMIIGLDGCKDPGKVYRAYNDSEGVTRQFYENGLVHANVVLGYEAFKPDEWEVVTDYDTVEGRHWAAYSPRKDVTINGVLLKKGEKLFFEEAYKYGPEERDQLWRDAKLIQSTEVGNGSDDYHLHLLTSAALNLPTSPSQYAAHPIPSFEEWQSLWTAWDNATKAMVPREELLSKPIKLRNSLIFYLGHIPTFLDIHLTRALRGKLTEPKSYKLIFERGIDPDVDDPEKCHSHSEIPDEWPALDDILDYQERVRSRVRSIYQIEGLAENRILGEALWIGFEHEVMHLETFLYMLIQSERILPPPATERPDFKKLYQEARRSMKTNEWFSVPEQTLTIGLDGADTNDVPPTTYGWDNEKPARTVTVPAFEAQGRPITNGEYAKYLQANQSRRRPASWVLTHSDENYAIPLAVNGSSVGATQDFMSNFAVRTVFGPVPLEFAQDWPVMASYDELAEYAEWVGCRIPTFEETRSIYLHSALLKERGGVNHNGEPNGHSVNGYLNGMNGNSYSKINPGKPRTPDHQPVQYPSRDALPVFLDLDGLNVGFKHWHPTPVIQNGDRLAGQGELGGAWEWTSTPLAPHNGFKAMEIYPGYTSDFFDGKHNIILGGSWATHPRVAGRATFFNMSLETITTISPSTNQPVVTRTGVTSEDLQRIPEVAQEAFRSFSRSTTLKQRQEIVTRALDILEKKKDELARELTEQMGRPIAYTGVEVLTAIKRSRYLTKISDSVLGEEGVVPGEEEKGFRRYIKRKPVGVAFIIFAWNYPYLILVNSLIPAILAGNAVILKPSPQTPTIVEQFAAAFAEAGLPQNVIQYFHCGSPTLLETIVRSPLVNHVCFTGSVAGGLAVQKAASDRIVNVGLELGGKDPAYVRDDVDAAWAAEEVVDGAIFNSGQSCCAIERVYVHKNIYNTFVEEVKKVLSTYRVGDPFDKQTQIGPVISKRAKDTIQAHVADAIQKGAKDETPANETFENPPAEGNYVKPTLLTGVSHDMIVMTEETFGPVIPVMKVDSDEEAIKLMNSSEFGLTASVWTKDVAKAEELVEQVEAGTVFINRSDYPSPDLAWTGWKNSGRGVTLSRFGFEQFVKLKSHHIKAYPK